MRWFICAVIVLALTPRAFADDLDILRGTESVGAATFPRLERLLFRRPVGYGDRQRQFQQRDTGARSPMRLRDTVAGIAIPALVMARCSAAPPPTRRLRRLRRLQHAMAGLDHRRRSQLHARPLHRYRPELADRPRLSPARTNAVRLHRCDVSGSGTLHLPTMARCARAPAGSWAITSYPTALPALRSAAPITLDRLGGVRPLYGAISPIYALHPTPVIALRPSHHPDLLTMLSPTAVDQPDPAWLYGIMPARRRRRADARMFSCAASSNMCTSCRTTASPLDFASARVGAGLKF